MATSKTKKTIPTPTTVPGAVESAAPSLPVAQEASTSTSTSTAGPASLLPPLPKRPKAPSTRTIRHPGNGIPGDPDEFTTAEERARPTKRAEAMYRRYEAMGQARTLQKLAAQIVLEDWASDHYYRQNRGEPMDAFYRRLRKEMEKAGPEETASFLRHRDWQQTTLNRWSSKYGWQERVAAFDQEQADILERETLMARIDMNRRQATAAAVLHQESFSYTRDLIKDGKLQGRDAVQAFLGAATQERVALGASTSIQEQRGKLGLGVTQQGAVNVHQDVDVHMDGNVTVSHEHSGSVQIQVTQLNVDLLRLLQDAAAPTGPASLQWRQALGLLTSGSTSGPDAADGAALSSSGGASVPSYQRLGAWVVPAELAPGAAPAATSPALPATDAAEQEQPPRPAATPGDFRPIVESMPPPPPPPERPQPPQHVALTSSDLASAAYDAPSATLDIAFVSGATYRYSEVPPEVYDGLLSAESAGGYFHTRIRGQYPYERLASAE